jgi:hypothetical protein
VENATDRKIPPYLEFAVAVREDIKTWGILALHDGRNRMRNSGERGSLFMFFLHGKFTEIRSFREFILGLTG